MNNLKVEIYKKDWLILNDMYALKIVENKKQLKFYELQDKKVVCNNKDEFVSNINRNPNNILITDIYNKYIKSDKFPIAYNIDGKKINGYVKYSPFKAKYILCSGKPSDRTCLSWEYENIFDAIDGLIDITEDKISL